MSLKLSDIRQFDKLDFLAKQLVEGFITGLHKSPFHGFSVEFAEHKVYNSGESTRHVDWKVYARTDRLYTKQYEEETNLRCQILLDVSGSMYYPHPDKTKIKFAALTAAALTHLLTTQRDAVGLTTFSDKIEYQSPQSSTASNTGLIIKALDHALNASPSATQTRVSDVIHEIADKITKRSLVIILSDMFQNVENLDEIFKSLQHLRHNKHEILIFHVTDHSTELNFEFDDRPHQFIDLETKQTIKVNPRDVKEFYQQKTAEMYRELKLRCGQFKIDYIEADTSDPFDKVLGAYLIKRKKMK
ncbi:DUF58 domain-containing protein [Marinoscillum sp. MHG1-6]|uniref:DUF58 domain-containing protein n=1 Tax=Marinoscillum sp. MHG1-6 TaxID=2959627 RepID=UPI002157D805|nr:DUF58 domain-containing protein [Marinoscillum sp. MHG1-6]